MKRPICPQCRESELTCGRELCQACKLLQTTSTAPAHVVTAPRRVLVTGSRAWTDRDAIRDALGEHWAPGNVLVTGACPNGADAIAEHLWRSWGGPVERHPADWSEGRSAGQARNAAMVALGADICLAFIRDDSPGASCCARLAE